VSQSHLFLASHPFFVLNSAHQTPLWGFLMRSDRDERLVLDVPEAGRLLGLSRNASYEAAKRGDIPTIRIGKLIRVPKAAFQRMLERAGAK
jgi:excisionase family DNA binding protein